MIEKDGTDERGNMIYRVSGKTNLADFERYFDVDIPQFEDLDVATLNGFFLEEEYSLKLNHPLRVGNFSFIPVEMENSNVKEFRVTQIKPKKKVKDEEAVDQTEKK